MPRHDKPYSIFEPFGARPNGSFDETEEFVSTALPSRRRQRQTGLRFDLYSVDFWVDYKGTLKECNPDRFPNAWTDQGELRKLGTAPGLWIDSSWGLWSIGGNPTVQACLNVDPDQPDSAKQVSWGRQSFCRPRSRSGSMYVEAFRHHLRENGVRLLSSITWPRPVSIPITISRHLLDGAVMDAVIAFLHALDA